MAEEFLRGKFNHVRVVDSPIKKHTRQTDEQNTYNGGCL